jgi:hypothetical protein
MSGFMQLWDNAHVTNGKNIKETDPFGYAMGGASCLAGKVLMEQMS